MTTAEVVCEEIPIRRVRKGGVVAGTILIRFDGGPFATLGIGEGWVRKRKTGEPGFERYDVYDVRRLETDLPGRAFSLRRDPSAVKGPEDDEAYAALVADDRPMSVCSCRGFAAAETRGLACKHLVALTHLVETGRL